MSEIEEFDGRSPGTTSCSLSGCLFKEGRERERTQLGVGISLMLHTVF